MIKFCVLVLSDTSITVSRVIANMSNRQDLSLERKESQVERNMRGFSISMVRFYH